MVLLIRYLKLQEGPFKIKAGSKHVVYILKNCKHYSQRPSVQTTYYDLSLDTNPPYRGQRSETVIDGG